MSGELNGAARAGLEPGTTAAWQATVLLDDQAGVLLPGARGSARRLVLHRSAAGWLWHYACRTFQFKL